jgi:hypothetical protein
VPPGPPPRPAKADVAPAARPAPPVAGGGPRPALLETLRSLSVAADAAGVGVLHLVLPDRAAVLGPDGSPRFDALEEGAAHLPVVARDWVPLRAAFAHEPSPGILWRADGRRLTVEGSLALLKVLLSVSRARLPSEAGVIARATSVLGRADLGARPRRELPAETGPAFLGTPLRETEPVLDESIFFDIQQPALLPGLAGLEAWSSRGAPLPWRVLMLTAPGLGGSAAPAAPGWWLRHLAAECLISEALLTAPPDAVLAVKPGLVVTLAEAG